MQTTTDRVERAALLADPGKDLAHHLGVVKGDVTARFPAAFLLVHVALAVGRMAQDPAASLLGSIPVALPRRLRSRNAGALVFSTDTLDLEQHLLFRGLPERSIKADDRHPGAGQLLPPHDVGGVVAREAVRARDIEAIHPARCSHVASALQGRPH
jgi:hypothetical protein